MHPAQIDQKASHHNDNPHAIRGGHAFCSHFARLPIYEHLGPLEQQFQGAGLVHWDDRRGLELAAEFGRFLGADAQILKEGSLD
jgi:hypothetical protein